MATRKKRIGGAGTADDQTLETVQKYGALVRAYGNVIIGALVFVIAIVIIAVYHHRSVEAQEDQAWAQVSRAYDPKGGIQLEDFDGLIAKYEGTSAEAYLRLAYASRLYGRGPEGGSREFLTRAKTQLEATLKLVPGTGELAHILAKSQLDGLNACLDDASFWSAIAATTSGSIAPPSSASTPEKNG